MCYGFFLVTNVLIVSRFGQKHLLNALNVNVNVNVDHLVSFPGLQILTLWVGINIEPLSNQKRQYLMTLGMSLNNQPSFS